MFAVESYIGIFWFYKDTLICKRVGLSETHEDTIGLHDSPFQHIQEWEENHIFLPEHSELFGTEYQELPRGRVLYSSKKKLFLIYADKMCLSKTNKKLIANNFNLSLSNTVFKSDPHYKVFNYC